MSKYWSEITRSIDPYVPGEQPKDRKYIKLNTNENPYPPSPKVIEAIRKAAGENLQLYPDPNCEDLRGTLADYYKLSPDQIFIGNGSDEVLAFSFMAFFDQNQPVLFPDITYSFYEVYVNLFKLKHKLIPLNEDFSCPVEPFLIKNGGIVLANPNAPTTRYIPAKDLIKIISFSSDRVVMVDEAYVDFGGDTMVQYINEYPNLLVTQTLSKSRALAGLRVGFAFGHRDLIKGLNRIKNSINSYTVNRLSLAGAKAAIEDDEYFRQVCSKIAQTRERTVPFLKELGFKVLDSRANFLFVSHETAAAKILFQELRNKGILVRYFNKPRIDNYLRISIGTHEEMDVLLEKLKEILQQLKK